MDFLSERLLAICGEIIEQQPLADIGADHAYLSTYLIRQNLVPRVIMVEVNPGPYRRAVQAIQSLPGEEQARIEVRLGNGLQVIEAAEVATVIIAGMGGETIGDILSFDWCKAGSFRRYVFQPMSRAEYLRGLLAEQGWPVINERVIREKKQFHVIITAEPGERPYRLGDLAREIGPVILQEKERYRDYIEYCCLKYQRIYKQLQCRKNRDRSLLALYRRRYQDLEEILDGN